MSKPPASNREVILDTANALRWQLGSQIHDRTVEALYGEASAIAGRAVNVAGRGQRAHFQRTLDRLLTNRLTGFPLMFLILAVIFWITITGANVPSSLLSSLLLDTVHPVLHDLGKWLGLPWWLLGLLLDGIYLSLAWVVSVMLPPMAIFFPLFTLLEDFGYLPRVAFNLDRLFQRAGAHGKQALTMAMGYGCNAAGIVATRVIDSPRERLIAILTNNFSICNGRWPTQILLATIFVGVLAPPAWASLVSSLAVIAIVLIGIVCMFLVSWGLSRTILRGEASAFSLELPPYRPPRILQTLYTSMVDRTCIVLWRAMVWAAPAGAVIWLISNVRLGDLSLAEHCIGALNPLGWLIGLNGIVLLAFIIAIPANEIVIPTILMLTALVSGFSGVGSGAGVLFELESASATGNLLRGGGWTMLTGINLMLFSLLHNPCSTTLYTIYKETNSAKWTLLSAVLPLALGFAVCFFVTQLWRMAS